MDPLEIGYVIEVKGDTVLAQLGITNLLIEYHGKKYRIGQLGTYVTIPLERQTLIGYLTRVAAEGDLSPGPNPAKPRVISIEFQLLGTIQGDKFTRGVNRYPTLGDPVRIAVDEDFELIFGCFDELAEVGGIPKAFAMGRFAMDTDFEVKVLGKEFFAKHVAVMGNSGSGKSVTTAKIVYEASKLPHSQVVMFDMHGEYLRAFSDEYGNPLPNVTYLSDRNLVLPYWMLSYEEFEQLFVDRHNVENMSAQQIFLRKALEELKQPAAEELDLRAELTIDTPVYYAIEQLRMYAANMNDARFVTNTDNYAFSRLPYRQLPRSEQDKLLQSKRMEFNPAAAEGETPHATYNGRLLGLMNQIESKLNDRRYDFLLRPFAQAQRNLDLAPRLHKSSTLAERSRAVNWVIRLMLGQLDERKNVTIVDLSGLPFDVVDTTVAVLTRALFDFNFWSPPDVRHPVLLCFEEAHNYLPRKPQPGRKTFARDAVEKVAKEGRKYGVAAMIVSQRPSEISETVLSQCNSMILMRMNNPDDQEYAARVVSDQFRSLISLLPSMRPGEGFIIGDAVLMPMRTLIDMPPRLPQSANLDFFDLWSTGGNGYDIDRIIDRWWRQERMGTQQRADGPMPEADPPSEGGAAARAPAEGRFEASESLPELDPTVDEDAAEELDAGECDQAEIPCELEVGEEEDCRDDGGASSTMRSKAEQKLADLAALLSGRRGEEPKS